MTISKPLRIRVANFREDDTIHVCAYAVGSPKAKRRTLCDQDPAEMRELAPFRPGDHRDPFWDLACDDCRERLAI